MHKGLWKKILARVLIWSVLFLMYLPIFLLVVFSFSENITISFHDYRFGFGLYRKMFENPDIGRAVFNTLVIAVVSGLLATLLGTMACLGLMAMKRRARGTVMSVNSIPIVNADIVTAFAVMLLFVTLGFGNNGWVKLILAHTLIGMPFAILVVLPRFRQLDSNLFEAGQDLGASPLRSFFTVVVPQLIPAMVTAFFIAFTISLDDFIVTLYNNDGVQTISTMVYSATKKDVPAEFRALSTTLFLAVLAVLLIYNWRSSKKNKIKKGENKK